MTKVTYEGSPDSTVSICRMPKKVPPSSAFAQRLIQLRQASGLTQTALAERIESSQRAVSRYETVAELPPSWMVVKLAKTLRVTTDELLGVKAPKKPAASKLMPSDPETKRLWKKFQQIRTLPDKDQRAVIRLINSLVQTKQAS